jgi:hypothetical protein
MDQRCFATAVVDGNVGTNFLVAIEEFLVDNGSV